MGLTGYSRLPYLALKKEEFIRGGDEKLINSSIIFYTRWYKNISELNSCEFFTFLNPSSVIQVSNPNNERDVCEQNEWIQEKRKQKRNCNGTNLNN